MVRKQKQEKERYNKQTRGGKNTRPNNAPNNRERVNPPSIPEGRASYQHKPNHSKPTSGQPQTVSKPQNMIVHRDLKINIPDGVKRRGVSVDQDEKSFKRQKIEKTLEALKGLEGVLQEFQYPQQLPVDNNLFALLRQIEKFQKVIK